MNNHSLPGGMPDVPWTGVKDAGPGVAASPYAYPAFVRRRTVFVDTGSKPDPWWRPIDEDMVLFSNALVSVALGKFTVVFKLLGVLRKRVKTIIAWGEAP